MDQRKRFGLAALWMLVAVLALGTIEELTPTIGTIASLLAAILALLLAVIYVLNPGGVLDRRPF